MVEFNSEPDADTWDGEDCNEFKGTDGLLYPAGRKKNEKIQGFIAQLCRSITFEPVKSVWFDGSRLQRYTVRFPDLRNRPHEQCFCQDPPDGCPPAGMLDMEPCVGAPLFLSKPHFLEVDPKVQNMVNGLQPTYEAHEPKVDFDLLLGNPIRAASGFQFNLLVFPVEEFEPMANLTSLHLPMFWAEEALTITEIDDKLLVWGVHIFYFFRDLHLVMKWCCLLFGILGCAFCGFFSFFNPSVTNVIPITKENEPVELKKSAKVMGKVKHFKSMILPEEPKVPTLGETVDVDKWRDMLALTQ